MLGKKLGTKGQGGGRMGRESTRLGVIGRVYVHMR